LNQNPTASRKPPRVTLSEGWYKRATRDASGFTLIEVLVALVVLAITFGFAYDALSGALGWTERSQNTQKALTIAESMLQRVGNDIVLQDGSLAGRTSDGFAWQIDTTPYGNASNTAAGALAGHQVEIVVSWTEQRNERQVRLLSVRLAPRGSGL
jgi:general secretion pathway protein I